MTQRPVWQEVLGVGDEPAEADHLDTLRADGKVRPRRPSAWALLTVLPVVLLGLGELVALVNRQAADTLSEVTWWALGEPLSLRHHLVTAWTVAWLSWLGLHWLVDRHYWGAPQLVILILGGMLTACALCLIAQP